MLPPARARFAHVNINVQLKSFQELRVNDPEKAKKIYEKGEELVKFATNGELRKLRMSLEQGAEDEEILLYFVAKMFTKSLANGHLMIASYLIDQGYDFKAQQLPPSLHEALLEVDDFRGVEICEFLMMKGYDVNSQASKTWLTPLHIAVQRNLINTVKFLISNGADVNAVADKDVMPLRIALNNDESDIRNEIVELLESKGAKETWRRDTIADSISSVGDENYSNVFSTVNSTVKMVSFKGDGLSVQVNEIQSNNPSPPKMVRFTGGSLPPPPTLPIASVATNDVDERVLADEFSSKVYIEESDDGAAMMFSTG